MEIDFGIDLSEGPALARGAVVAYFDPLLVCYDLLRRGGAAIASRFAAPKLSAEVKAAVEERVSVLREIASLEGLSLSTASQSDMFRFLAAIAPQKRPLTFLLDNGNFRFVWKGSAETQIGLQFLGGGVVQFVLFAYRDDVRMIVRSSGRDSIDGVLQQIKALGLMDLIHEEG